MKKILSVALAIAALTACSVKVDDKQNTNVSAGPFKYTLTKAAALSISEFAMKQAGVSSDQLSPATDTTLKTTKAPRTLMAALAEGSRSRPVHLFSTTKENCVQYTGYMCTSDGSKCQFGEDYTACGNDFKGKITRTFEGTPSSTRISVKFDQYAEKPTTDAKHFAFDGDSSISGTVGVNAANLNLHVDGTTGTYLDVTYVTIKSSSTMTVQVINGKIMVDGTQTGTIDQTKQTESLTYTALTFENSCTTGPTSGTIKTLLDDKQTVTTITGCGKGTIVTDNGSAVDLTSTELAEAFGMTSAGSSGGNGATSGITGVGTAVNAGNMLAGIWLYNTLPDMRYISITDNADGTFSIYVEIDTDVDGDGLYRDNTDTTVWGYGTFTATSTELQVTMDYEQTDFYDGTTSVINWDASTNTGTPDNFTLTFNLIDNNSLTLGSLAYTRQIP